MALWQQGYTGGRPLSLATYHKSSCQKLDVIHGVILIHPYKLGVWNFSSLVFIQSLRGLEDTFRKRLNARQTLLPPDFWTEFNDFFFIYYYSYWYNIPQIQNYRFYLFVFEIPSYHGNSIFAVHRRWELLLAILNISPQTITFCRVGIVNFESGEGSLRWNRFTKLQKPKGCVYVQNNRCCNNHEVERAKIGIAKLL